MVKIRLTAPDKWTGEWRVVPRFARDDSSPALRDVGDVQIEPGSAPKRGRRGGRGSRVVLCVGSRESCEAKQLRDAAGHLVRWLADHDIRRAALDVDGIDALEPADRMGALAEGLMLGAYRFDRWKSNNKRTPPPDVHLLSDRVTADMRGRLRSAVAVCESVYVARDLAHEPPNVINPVTLVRRVRQLVRGTGLKCTVLDDKQLAKMRAGAILAVGQGSDTPCRLILLEHAGRGAAAKRKPVVLVGKAITFDTGGYSLKDRNGMVGMKYDKCGGMTVVATMLAADALGIRTPIVGVIAAAENMVSRHAYRPNDIITTLSGKTVEIISTDAEGRLVLADALTYAQRKYKPRAMIDLATLTGGVVVALGSLRAGIMSTDDALTTALTESGERTGERLWRLPLDDEYLDLIKGDDSDIKNSGGREAHPIIGGIFLKQFVDAKTPWAHLDIAGVADTDKDRPICRKGATGFGVRLLVDYLQRLDRR